MSEGVAEVIASGRSRPGDGLSSAPVTSNDCGRPRARPTGALRTQAVLVHPRWSGPCAASLGCGSIQRLPSTDGAGAAAYATDENVALRSCSGTCQRS
ncbi:MAG: hypothetical protein WCJ30_24960 [Deltaproteobacteria bacterium]